MNNYLLIILAIAIVLLTMFLIICNTSETFRMPTLKDTKFLKQCFDEKSIKEFEKYYNVADVNENKNKGMLFTTPINELIELQNFNLTKYGNGLLVNNICVSPDSRRHGVAKKLMKKMIKDSRKNNIDFLFLQVKNNNIGAIKLYKSLGFEENHRFSGSEGITYLNMILKL
jgi:ribosomal protein S18 acetylase RimI-like enzyme